MGFFKDFKEDLSQAVDELATEGGGASSGERKDAFAQDLIDGANRAASGSKMTDLTDFEPDAIDLEQLSFMDLDAGSGEDVLAEDAGISTGAQGISVELPEDFSALDMNKDFPAAEIPAESFDDVSFGMSADAPEVEEIPEIQAEPEINLEEMMAGLEAMPELGLEPATEPMPEPVAEPVIEPEPVIEAMPEPEPVVEPTPEPVIEPEPVVAAEPVAEPESVIEEAPAEEPQSVPEIKFDDIPAEPEPEMQVEEVTIEPDLQLEAAAAEVEIPEVTIPEATMSESIAAAEEEEEPAPIAFQTDEEEAIPSENIEMAAAPAAMPADDTEETSTMDTSIFEENVKMSDVNDFDIEDGPATDESSVITQGMTIKGDVTSEGSLEVIGAIQGNIAIKGKLTISGTINGDSKAGEIFADSAKITGEVNSTGSVKIGQASVILGNVTGTSAVIAGAVKGDIDVHGPVILDTSAIVMGDIKSKSVQINNGAVIEGHCSQCYADVSPTSFFQDLKEA